MAGVRPRSVTRDPTTRRRHLKTRTQAHWTPGETGRPDPRFRGRIGVDIARSNPNVVYAVIDNYDVGRPAMPGENDAYGRALPPQSSIVKGVEVYRSDDRGATWRKTSGQTPETAMQMMGLGNTYNWVFTQIRVDTKNENRVYVLALEVSVSDDAGATFKRFTAGGGDNHRMWIDPVNPKVVYTAHDQGFTMTIDGGRTKREATGIRGTQFYNVDSTWHAVPGSGSGRRRGSFAWRSTRARAARCWRRCEGVLPAAKASCTLDLFIRTSSLHGFYGNFTRTSDAPQAGVDGPPLGCARGRLARRSPGTPKGRWRAPQRSSGWPVVGVVGRWDFLSRDPDVTGYQYVYRSRDRGDTWQAHCGPPDNTAPDGVNPWAFRIRPTHIAESR